MSELGSELMLLATDGIRFGVVPLSGVAEADPPDDPPAGMNEPAPP